MLRILIVQRCELIQIAGQLAGIATVKNSATDALRALATRIRHVPISQPLSHGHAIELAVALATAAPSYNVYCADPVPPALPISWEQTLRAISRFQRRLLSLGWGGDRLGRTLYGLDVLRALAGSVDGKSFLRERFQNEHGVSPLRVIDPVSGQARQALPHEVDLVWEMGSHYFLSRPASYVWDETEKRALALGYTKEKAGLIRECQREAMQHTWNFELWFEVGLLEPDLEAFLLELRTEADWESRFDKLLETDGYRAAPLESETGRS